ncbi:MAG: Ig-like domain-containing protein [Candidatus Ozemobacteraceae bacterium]
MKKSKQNVIRLFLALGMVLSWMGTASALPDVSAANVTLSVDVGGDGVANSGDTFQFQCLATDNANIPFIGEPYVDLSAINGPSVLPMPLKSGILFECTWPVPVGTINYVNPANPYKFPIRARNASGAVGLQNTSSIYVDNAKPLAPDGVQLVVNGAVSAGPALAGQTFGFQITDTRFQNLPSNTTCYIDLSPIGLSAKTVMTYQSPSLFHTANLTPLPAKNDIQSAFTVRLTDPFNQYSEYTSGDFIIDQDAPTFKTATVQILSGNPIARPGDVIRITCELNKQDGDTVVASQSQLAACNPAMPTTLNPSGTQWTIDVTLGQEIIKSSALSIDLTATDNAGNVRTRRVTVPVDLDPPDFNGPSVEILGPDGATSYSGTLASATDWLRFSAEVTSNLPDVLEVTVNLAPLGGLASHPLTLVSTVGNKYSYVGAFQVPLGSIENVPPPFVASITARDSGGNIVYRLWAPPIYIDNLPPTVTNSSLTRVGGGSPAKLGDSIIISCQVTNVDGGGPPWVDLRSIGGNASETLTEVSPGSYSGMFFVGNPSTGNPTDNSVNFLITTYDNAKNPAIQFTNTLKIDNEPPVQQVATYTVNPQLDTTTHEWVRIGDTLTLQLGLVPPFGKTRDNETVTVDLSSVGGNTAQAMSWNGVATYTYSWKIATGTLNDGAVFPISVTDDDGNNMQTQIEITQFDNKPPNPGVLTMSGKETVDSPGAVNVGDILNFRLPVTVESPDDHRDSVLDLSTAGGNALQIMDYSPNLYSFTLQATPTVTNLDATNYYFVANVYDKAGNCVAVRNGPHTVDCWPPRILDVQASLSGVGPGNVGIIGTTLSFHVQTVEEDGGTPYIDLSSLGRSNKEYLTASSVAHWWDISFPIATGTLNYVPLSWVAGIQDNAGNLAARTSPALFIDNMPPQVTSIQGAFIQVSPNSRIPLGQSVTFTVTTDDPASQWGNTSLDLTAIGGTANTFMTLPDGVGPGGNYTLSMTTLLTTQSYTNYIFKGVVFDANGNKKAVTSAVIDRIDCQPPVLGASGIFISKDNGDNPSTAIANTNDQLTVFTGMTNGADATATAVIVIDGIGDAVSAQCTFVSIRNRYEAVFTVPARGGAWGDLRMQPIYYRLSASDAVGNAVASGPAVSTFTVNNMVPTIIDSVNWQLNPNVADEYSVPEGYPVLNVGSGFPVDLLWVEATIDQPLSTAFLNLSNLPGAPASITLPISGSTARNTTGISVPGYVTTDAVDASFSITLRDLAGNSITATKTFRIDTKRPRITNATYNGSVLNVVFQEPIRDLDATQWDLVCSNSAGIATSITLLPAETQAWIDSFDVTFSADRQKIIAGWASQPLTLRVRATNAAPVRDLSMNWGYAYTAQPVIITDSTWREVPRITEFAVTRNWPAFPTIFIDLTFNKPMDATTLLASNAVLLYKNLSYNFATVDYPTGYVFQPEDTFEWLDTSHLRITLCEDGAAWVARKLGSETTTLKFATRMAATVFVRDSFGKPMQAVSTNAPLAATVSRPYEGNPLPPFEYSIESAVSRPVLDLTSRTLTLTTSDRTLVYQDDFQTLSLVTPRMGMPVPSFNKRSTGFHNHIQAWDADVGTFRALTFEPLELSANASLSSTSITLKLTDTDISGVFALFASNPNANPIWGLKIDSGAFQNWWGQPNQAFLPSGNPGDMTVISPVVAVASLVACSISDAPPVRPWPAGALTFECEINPALYQGVQVPISLATPTGRIVRNDLDSTVVNGLFRGWTTRTVDGSRRYVARFVNAEVFPADLSLIASVDARIEIAGARDIFGNAVHDVSSYVYDLSKKSATAAGGFTVASVPLVLDAAPPVVATINPPGNIGVLPPDVGNFEFTFNEPMNTSVSPALAIATTGQTIACSFQGWNADGVTARFTNTTAIEINTPNGTYTYNVSGAADIAGNVMVAAHLPFEIRTQAPAVIGVSISTVQSFVSLNPVVDQPYSPMQLPGYATVHLTYVARPTRDLPHVLRFYDAAGVLTAAAPIVFGLGVDAVATLTPSDFAIPPGPAFAELALNVRDAAGNESGQLKRLLVDQIVPNLTQMTFGGIGTYTGGIVYYSPSAMGADANVTLHASNATDAIRLTAAGLSVTQATVSWSLSSPSSGEYLGNFGSGLSEGIYAVSAVDAAGNPAGGDASRTLFVDLTPPTVVSVEPATAIGTTPLRGTTFAVAYSERMDPNSTPTLELATGSPIPAVISMEFTGWANRDNATTALFVNAVEINGLYPAGTYAYNVSGGFDLAHNAALPSSGFEVNVQSQGPVADMVVLTTQPGIFADPLENQPFSPLVSAGGSASIRLTYAAGAFNAPHRLLIYDEDERIVATMTIPEGNPTFVTFPGAALYWASRMFPTNGIGPKTYRYKLVDRLGYFSTDYLGTIIYDSRVPRISSFDFNDGGRGLITNGAKHYSPAFGPANITLTTDATDTLRLVVVTGSPAPETAILTAQDATHTIDFGGSLSDGIATFTAADLAGNFALGKQSGIRVVIDGTAPRVTSTLPSSPIGAFAVKAGAFEITFNEPMNPASAPTASIFSGNVLIPLTPATGFNNGWISSFTCRMINTTAIVNLPISTYTWAIAGAIDEAGNVCEPANIDLWINSQGPAYSTTLRTQQRAVTSDTWLINQPISPNVSPRFGFLSVNYQQGPFGIPHQVLVSNQAGTQIATLPLNPIGKSGTATVNLGFFGLTPPVPEVGPVSYGISIQDDQGNVSPSPLKIIYDALPPTLSAFTLTGGARPATTTTYLNPDRHGLLNATLTSNGTDALRLVFSAGTGTATSTYAFIRNGSSYTRGLSRADLTASAYPDGLYRLSVVDAAGNFAVGAVAGGITAVQEVVIDRTAPTLIDAQVLPASPLHSLAAGMATFTVVFSEMMDTLASATPTLRLTNGNSVITCRFTGWINQTLAVFTNQTAITPDMPAGDWYMQVAGYDLADNAINAIWPTPVYIGPRGPIVSAWRATTYQQTTASLAYPRGQLENEPFGPLVAPNGATLTVTLNAAPEAVSLPIRLHFTQNGVTIASFPVTFSGTVATFSWYAGHGPIPGAFTTYQMRLYDGFGNPSLETCDWSCDPVAPTTARQAVVGGVKVEGDETIYFNPALHPALSIPFLVTGEELAPVMRIRGSVSTETLTMSLTGESVYTGSFNGAGKVGNTLADGVYIADLVDRAGNVGIPLIGQPSSATIVLDTTTPQVTTFTMQIGGVAVTRYSPAAGLLEIRVETTESLSPTGLQYIEVRTDSNILIRRLPLIDQGSGKLGTTWDGTKADGILVAEGAYRFYATDATGNHSTDFLSVFVATSLFRVNGIVQVSPTEADLTFSQSVDQTGIDGAQITVEPADVAILGQALGAQTRVRLTFDHAFTHSQSYTVTIVPGTLRSTDGVPLIEGRNTAAFTADTRPPAMTSATMQGTNGAREFIVTFDERLSSVSAQNTTLYRLSGTTVAGNPVSASLRADGSSVLLLAREDLTESRIYTITAVGVEDLVGNKSTAGTASQSFRGRDTTPPDIRLAVFSNPAVESDIMAAVRSVNEPLASAPSLDVVQGTTALTTVTMTQGLSAQQFMAGIHLEPSASGFGTARVTGCDAAGNVGTAQVSFSVNTVNPSVRSSVKSYDGRLSATFLPGALRAATLVKILPQPMTTSVSGDGRASVRPLFSVLNGLSGKVMGSRKNTASRRGTSVKATSTGKEVSNLREALVGIEASNVAEILVASAVSELIPVGDGFEISFNAARLASSYALSVRMPAGKTIAGNIGLYQLQDNGSWKWLAGAGIGSGGSFEAHVVRPGVFALLRDETAPRITLDTVVDPDKPFATVRPKFMGRIEERGSGLHSDTLIATIDGAEQAISGVASDGSFIFVPLNPLVCGRHAMSIRVADNAGNLGESVHAQFSVKVPLAIGEMVTFPNPARSRTMIRISANRDDVREDLVEVTIYDVAGHRVRWLDGVRAVAEAGSARFVYDIPWDLRNESGTVVANGVYLARVEVRDPENSERKVKKTHKIVVLR